MYGDPLPNRPNLNTFFAMVIWGPTTKFNLHQYFRLYGIYNNSIVITVTIYYSHKQEYILKLYLYSTL